MARPVEGSLGRAPGLPRAATGRGLLAVLLDRERVLGWLLVAPVVLLLLTLVAYPFAVAIGYALSDRTIADEGVFIGLENFANLLESQIYRQTLRNTFLFTAGAVTLKLLLGLGLGLLLNEAIPFRRTLRAAVLLPWIVPTVLSAIAFWWIYDPQFSIISWVLIELGLRETNVDFINTAWPARWSLIWANIWRGIPFVAISLLAGLQTISPSLYEAALLDGATPWQRFRHITFPMLLPILAIVMTFSIIFTFTDFQLVYAITRGGPVNSTHLMATLAFQRGIPGGQLGEGAAIAVAMIPFLVFATLFSYFALARRKWQQGESND